MGNDDESGFPHLQGVIAGLHELHIALWGAKPEDC
jgi:hypothetical protein